VERQHVFETRGRQLREEHRQWSSLSKRRIEKKVHKIAKGGGGSRLYYIQGRGNRRGRRRSRTVTTEKGKGPDALRTKRPIHAGEEWRQGHNQRTGFKKKSNQKIATRVFRHNASEKGRVRGNITRQSTSTTEPDNWAKVGKKHTNGRFVTTEKRGENQAGRFTQARQRNLQEKKKGSTDKERLTEKEGISRVVDGT